MCLLEGGGGKGKKVHVSGLKDSIRTDVVERVRQSVRCHLKCFEGCLCMLGVCVFVQKNIELLLHICGLERLPPLGVIQKRKRYAIVET